MIEYRSAESRDLNSIREFLAENGWARRVADEIRFRKMIENASRTVVAFDGERLIGFARALCDDVSNGYIGTVAKDKRKSGVGRKMIERLMGDDPNITWVLRAGHGRDIFPASNTEEKTEWSGRSFRRWEFWVYYLGC